MSIQFFITKSLFEKEKLNTCNGILCSILVNIFHRSDRNRDKLNSVLNLKKSNVY